MKSKKNTCKDVFKHICDNLDEQLDSPQCREIQKHMEGCSDCLTYLDTLKKTITLYREYPIPLLTNASRTKLHKLLDLPA